MRSTEHDGKFPIGLVVTFMQYLRMLGNVKPRQVIPSGLQNWRTSSQCTRAAVVRLLTIVKRLPPPGDRGRSLQNPQPCSSLATKAESCKVNPYEPPVPDSPLSPRNASSDRRPWFLPQLLLTVSIGSFPGSRFVSPFVHSPGDPQGKGSGIAISGFIAMVLFFGWRRYQVFMPVPASRSNVSVCRNHYSFR